MHQPIFVIQMSNMRIAVKSTIEQREEFLSKPLPAETEVIWVETDIPEADIYFDLCFEERGASFNTVTQKPVFVNAVISLNTNLPPNVIRINSWPGFLKRDVIEMAVKSDTAIFEQALNTLGWKYQLVPDVPGMVAARVLAMIINEAYFGLGDEISTKTDIDIAMKLGTNYPYGPFEWAESIGLHRIYQLLKKLSEEHYRYAPSSELEQQLKSIA